MEYLGGILMIAFGVFLPYFMVGWVLDAFEFERDGVEQQARIVSLMRTQTTRGNTTWTYSMESNGQTFERGFDSQQTLGDRIWMLELPQKPGERMLGRRGDSAFKLFVVNTGGYFKLLVLVCVALASAAAVPIIIVRWLNSLRRPRWSEPF